MKYNCILFFIPKRFLFNFLVPVIFFGLNYFILIFVNFFFLVDQIFLVPTKYSPKGLILNKQNIIETKIEKNIFKRIK